MKHTIFTILISLLLSSAVFSQGFVEVFRSEPGRKPPRGITSNMDIWSILDLNGNGSPDFTSYCGCPDDSILVRDGRTKSVVWQWQVPSQNYEEIEWTFVRFYEFHEGGENSYQATHGLLGLEQDGIHVLVDLETGNIDWQEQGIQIMAVADIDEDKNPEVVFHDKANKQVVAIGWDDGGSSSLSKRAPEPLKSNASYELTLKFESDPGLDVAYDGELFASANDFDHNGDGVMEIVVLKEDSNGDPTGMIIRNGATHEIKWEFKFPESGPARDDIQRGFHGLFDTDGDGQKEMLFGNRSAVTRDNSLNRVDENFEIVAVHDIDEDGLPDLVGRGLQDSTVQVWGAGTATSVSEGDLVIAGFQLKQNYPNPFNPSTTISYSVDSAGKVELKIYDLLGRNVRTLVDDNRSHGHYEVVWDGKSDLGKQVVSGHYFYQLKVDDFQSTKRMVLLK